MIPERALIVGAGLTGRSLLSFLHEKCDLWVTDTRVESNPEIQHFHSILSAEFPSARFIKPSELEDLLPLATTAYLSPGIPLNDPITGVLDLCGAVVSSDIELFLANTNAPVLGVTGTNGKSTVTTLLGDLLAPHGFRTGGNVGVPVLDLLDDFARGYVVELSSFQLERMPSPRLKVATILNITDDHIDHHGSFDAYAASKHKIYENCETAVFDGSDPITLPNHPVDSIAVNATHKWCVLDQSVVIDGDEINKMELSVLGDMNYLNVVIASAMAKIMGATTQELIEGSKRFKGLPHRTQLVSEIDGVSFINDSKATNVAATVAALTSLSNSSKSVVLLAGGDGKGVSFQSLAEPAKQFVKAAVLFGRDAELLGSALEQSNPIHYADSFEDAFANAHQLAESGDTVLLSPACASFDMFANFQERGNTFEKLVRQLKT